jgi:glycopeptide antibiotics resistance protein
MPMKLFIPLAILFLALNGLILGVGLMKIESPEAKAVLSGYHAHFMAFFVMAFILSLMLIRLHFHHAYVISFAYACGLAIALELMQGMTGYRHFSLLDILFGMLGAGLHWVIAWSLGRKIHYGVD